MRSEFTVTTTWGSLDRITAELSARLGRPATAEEVRNHIRGKADPLPTELTPIGEQYVIPGCERDPDRGPAQRSLWEG